MATIGADGPRGTFTDRNGVESWLRIWPSPRSRRSFSAMTDGDPTITNPRHYRTLWENEHVRVLEYSDLPGESTTPHGHPNSVMVTLSSFRRLLSSGGATREVELPAGRAVWLAAQSHAGENIGDTPTHTILVELKGAAAGTLSSAALGPTSDGPESGPAHPTSLAE